jgi:hypothetical protein
MGLGRRRRLTPLLFCLVGALAGGLLLAACDGGSDGPQAPAVLAHVEGQPITAADFERALGKLEPTRDGSARDLEAWRRQFQLMIDKELLLAEARALGLEDSDAVRARVRGWERAHLTGALVEVLMADRLVWDEADLAAFFEQRGGGSEARLWRRQVADRGEALALLARARDQGVQALGGAADLGWVNPLDAEEPGLAMLVARQQGAVELVEGQAGLALVEVAQVRQVSLAERRERAERALETERRSAANMALVEKLTAQYEVRLDTAAVNRLAATGSVERANPGLLLVRSSLGDWNVADFTAALAVLPPSQRRLPTLAAALGFQITRAYIISALLETEARSHGLYEVFETKRRHLVEQEMVDALWRREGLSKVKVNQAQARAYYEAHKGRYAGLEGKKLGRQVERDLREEQAAPYFEGYLEQLRQRYADQIKVDEQALSAFIADKRRGEAPVDM